MPPHTVTPLHQQHIAAIQEQLDRTVRLLKKVGEDRARERTEGLGE